MPRRFPPTQPHIAGRQGTARRRRCAFAARFPTRLRVLEARRSEPHARGRVGGSRDHSDESIVVRMREHRHRRSDARDERVDVRRGAATGSRGPRRARRQRFTHDGNMLREASATFDVQRITEAPDRLRQPDQRLRLAGPAVRLHRRRHRRAAALLQRQPVHLRGGRDASRTASARPTTRRAAASAIRTS